MPAKLSGILGKSLRHGTTFKYATGSNSGHKFKTADTTPARKMFIEFRVKYTKVVLEPCSYGHSNTAARSPSSKMKTSLDER